MDEQCLSDLDIFVITGGLGTRIGPVIFSFIDTGTPESPARADLIEQRRREWINAGADDAAAVRVRILFDEAADAAVRIDVDAAIAAGVVHFGAEL